MLTTQLFPFASSATEAVASMARRNVEAFDRFASVAKDTPAAPLFDIASKLHHSALDNFEAMSSGLGTETVKSAPKPASKKAKKPAGDAAKKAAGKGEKVAKSSADAAAVTKKAAKTTKKTAKTAKSGDTVALNDDLTAVTGIGPATMRKLNDAGVHSIADLASTSNKALKAIVEDANIRLLKFTPADLIADAKRLTKKAA